jgi:hypothetical protein
MNDAKFREPPVGNDEAILSEALLGNVQRLNGIHLRETMVKRKSRPQTVMTMKIVVVRKSLVLIGRVGSIPTGSIVSSFEGERK